MIASGSTFKVIKDMFPLLHVVWHVTEALVYSDYPSKAVGSMCLAIIWLLPVAYPGSFTQQ